MKTITVVIQAHEWHSGLVGSYASNKFNCLFGTCFPCCALATAKSHFDGSMFLFNLCCFSCSPGIVRNYIRSGYGIYGRPGISDCFLPIVCFPCVTVQLLNEVIDRGPLFQSIPTASDSQWMAPPKDYSCTGDPCDFFMTSICGVFETAHIYSLYSGAPLWFALFPGCFCPVSYCQTKHLLRKSYSIGGHDCLDDCIRPTLCLLIPYASCIYYYKAIASLREEVRSRKRAQVLSENKKGGKSFSKKSSRRKDVAYDPGGKANVSFKSIEASDAPLSWQLAISSSTTAALDVGMITSNVGSSRNVCCQALDGIA